MTRSRVFLLCLLSLAAVGCKAQATSDPATLNAHLDRKIEVLVRSQLGVPPDWNVSVGERTKSDTPGFDSVVVTFSPAADPTRREKMDFLLSKDGSTLARLSKWDLTKSLSDTISTSGRPVRGADEAKVTIINYDDLECPYCARMHAELFPVTLEHYKGLVKVIYKDDPLTEIHPWALHAAVDANCLAAASPSAYWSYVDYLHSHGEDVTGPDRDPAKSVALLDKVAREQAAHVQAAGATLNACIEKQDDRPVQASMKEAGKLGVDGTPTLFINGERLSGARPLVDVWATIDRALRAEGVTPPPNTAPAIPGTSATPEKSGSGGAQ